MTFPQLVMVWSVTKFTVFRDNAFRKWIRENSFSLVLFKKQYGLNIISRSYDILQIHDQVFISINNDDELAKWSAFCLEWA